MNSSLREKISRIRNCILALADQHVLIYDTRLDCATAAVIASHQLHSIIYTFEDSEAYTVKELLQPEVVSEITARAKMLKEA